MIGSDTVLQAIAKRCELKLSQKTQFTEECLSGIEELLQDVYTSRQPKPSDYEDRIELVKFMNTISKELYGSSAYPTVEEYGSFVMGIFSADSDLDLSVNFTDTEAKISRDKMIKALVKFAEKLRVLQSKGQFRDLKRVLGARVPIIKAMHCDSGIECDISVENWDGIKKSKIVQIICNIDVRFQQLSFLMKEWAKAHKINSAKTKTLNSLSTILLVAFHLQTREPPILPSFSTIFRDGTDPEKVMEVVREYVDFGKLNKESIADLFVSFLIKLASVKQHWSKGLCASTFSGTWILKVWADKIGYLSVEDFSTRSENVARAVNREQLDRIYDCIINSLNNLTRFKDGLIHKSLLKELLFGLDPIIGGKSKSSKRLKGRTRAQTLRAARKRKRRAERKAENKKAAHEPSPEKSPYNVLLQPTLLNNPRKVQSPANIYTGVPRIHTPDYTHQAGAPVTCKVFGQVRAAPLSHPGRGTINCQNGESTFPQIVPIPNPLLELRPCWTSSDPSPNPYDWTKSIDKLSPAKIYGVPSRTIRTLDSTHHAGASVTRRLFGQVTAAPAPVSQPGVIHYQNGSIFPQQAPVPRPSFEMRPCWTPSEPCHNPCDWSEEFSPGMSYNALQQQTRLNVHGNLYTPPNLYARVPPPIPTRYGTHHAAAFVIGKQAGSVTAWPPSQPGMINNQNGRYAVAQRVPLPSPSIEQGRRWSNSEAPLRPYEWRHPRD